MKVFCLLRDWILLLKSFDFILNVKLQQTFENSKSLFLKIEEYKVSCNKSAFVSAYTCSCSHLLDNKKYHVYHVSLEHRACTVYKCILIRKKPNLKLTSNVIKHNRKTHFFSRRKQNYSFSIRIYAVKLDNNFNHLKCNRD